VSGNVIDDSVYEWILGIRNPVLTEIFRVITHLGDWKTILVLGLVWAGFMTFWGEKKKAISLVLIYVVAIGVNEILKAMIGRGRPPIEEALVLASRNSFPSGHAVFSVFFFGRLIDYWEEKVKSKYKVVLKILGAGLIMGIIFSRLYLGVHWLSDVVGGAMLGLIWFWMSKKVAETD